MSPGLAFGSESSADRNVKKFSLIFGITGDREPNFLSVRTSYKALKD